MQSNPVDHLQEALQLLQRHGSHGLVEWFSALDWTHATAGRITDYQLRKQRRDALLTRALVKMPGESTWTRCSELAAAIRRFETRTWPRVQFMAEPPARFNEQDQCLFHAFKIGIKVPRTAQAVVNAIKITQESSGRNLGGDGVE